MLGVLAQLPTNAGTDVVSSITGALAEAWPVFLAMTGITIGISMIRRFRR